MARCYNCMKEYGSGALYCPHCGYHFDDKANYLYELKPGISLGKERYMIGVEINKGGFGIVYKAWDRTFQKMVAIKEYYPSSIAMRETDTCGVRSYSEKNIQEFEKGKKRFLNEARTMAKFSDHPNIIDVYDFFEENNTVYMVMEFMDGMTFKEFIEQQGGKVSQKMAVGIGLAVLDALKAVHKEKIVHRDINPNNIFICKDGRVKVFDFGAARFEDTDVSMILTPHYAPPEQYLTNGRQSSRTDLYAVGATLYYALTGIKPEESTDRLHKDSLVAPCKVDNSIPKTLSNAIMRAMALKEGLRFKSAEEFQLALQNKKKVLDVEQELKRRRKIRVFQMGTAIVTLTAMAGGCWFLYQKQIQDATLKPVSIEIWMKSDRDESGESAKERIKAMTVDFSEQYPQVDLNITVLSFKDYEKQINEAAEAGTLPDLFESTELDTAYLEKTEPLDLVCDMIPDKSQYLLLDQYESLFPEKRQIPLCVQIPVIYSRISSSEEKETSEKQKNVVRPEDIFLFEEIGLISEDSEESQWKAGSDSLEQFLDGQAEVYYSDTGDYQVLSEKIPAQFEVKIPSISNALLRPDHLWSVNASSTEEEKKAAQWLLSFMLADRAQNALGVRYLKGIPVSKSMCEVFVDVYQGELASVQNYLEVASPEGSEWLARSQAIYKKAEERTE